MKKLLTAIVCAIAMLPAVSSANIDTDSQTFKADATSYTVNFSWTDATFFGMEMDGLYGILFTDSTALSKDWTKGFGSAKAKLSSFNDVSGLTSGSFSLTFDGLTKGNTYFAGIGGLWFGKDGKVSVDSVTAAVPEPETYAMLLAGLGLIGAMARRRSSR